MKKKLEDATVYYGVVNPAGEKEGWKTTFPSEYQLPKIAKTLPGVQLHINHFLKKGDQQKGVKKVAPAGEIIEAMVHPKSGELWASFVIYENTHNGNIANNMLNNLGKDKNATGLSLGYRVALDPKTKNKKATQITDLSLCWKGARKNTIIRGKTSLQEYFGIKDNQKNNTLQNKKTKFEEEWKSISDQKKIPIQNENEKKDISKDISNILDTMNNNMDQDIKNEAKVIDFAAGSGIHVEKYDTFQAKNVMFATAGKIGVQDEIKEAGASGGNPMSNMTNYVNQQSVQNNLPPNTNNNGGGFVREAGKILHEAATGKRQRDDIDVNQLVNNLTQKPEGQDSMNVDDKNLLEKDPESLTAEELKKYLKLQQKNNNELKNAVQRLNMTVQEREQHDRNEMSKIIQDDIAPWVGEMLEAEGQNTVENRAAMKSLLKQMVEKPNVGSRGLVNFLHAAASNAKKTSANRAQDANKVEEEYQKQRKLAETLKAEQEKRANLEKQLAQLQTSFDTPVENVETIAAAASSDKKTRNDGGFTGRTENRDNNEMLKICFQAHKNADLEQRYNTPDHVLMERAKVLANDWNSFALAEGEDLTYGKFGLFPDQDPNYQWPSRDIQRFYGYN